jgi:hypothetical protein
MLNTRLRQTLGWKFPVEVLVDYLQLLASNKLETINGLLHLLLETADP